MVANLDPARVAERATCQMPYCGRMFQVKDVCYLCEWDNNVQISCTFYIFLNNPQKRILISFHACFINHRCVLKIYDTEAIRLPPPPLGNDAADTRAGKLMIDFLLFSCFWCAGIPFAARASAASFARRGRGQDVLFVDVAPRWLSRQNELLEFLDCVLVVLVSITFCS